MATSSATSITSLLPINISSCKLRTLQNDGQCSFLRRRSDFHRFGSKTPSNTDLIVRRATPEVAGDLLSSFSLPAIPGLPLIGDNPWLVAAAGLFVGLPLIVQRLVTFTKELDAAAQVVENIADAVEDVAKKVDKAAEEFGEALPDGGLKQFVHSVELMAEETAKDAQKVEDMMDVVEELDDKLEALLKKQSKGTGQA